MHRRHTEADFAEHSLCSGFLTSTAAAGASIWKMREVARHKSVQVLSDCMRNSDLLKDHAGQGLPVIRQRCKCVVYRL